MKRVVIACFNRSGLYQYATQLAQSLAETGSCEVLFITSSFNPAQLYPSSSAVTILAIPAPHTPFSFIWATFSYLLMYHRQIISAIKKFQPHVIHVVDAYPWYFFWQKFFRTHPTVVTVHDPKAHVGEKLGWILSTVTSYLLKQAKKAIVHGKSLEKALKNKFTSKNISVTVIPLGNFNFFQKWQEEVTPRPNSILFFGRLVEYKGIDILIRAVEILIQEGHNIHLTIAGEGNIQPYRQLVTAHIKKHVTFDNRYIPDQEVAKIFQSNKIVVLPYKEATQSAVIPIAFALKRPVIATRVGAIPEVIQNEVNGLLVPPQDAVALSKAIIRLLFDDNLQQQLITGGSHTAQNQLAWDKIAQMHIECYGDILR